MVNVKNGAAVSEKGEGEGSADEVWADANTDADSLADDKLMREMEQLKVKLEIGKKTRKTVEQKEAEMQTLTQAIFQIVYQTLPQMKEIKSSIAEFRNFHEAVNEEVTKLRQQNDYLYDQNEELKNRVLDFEIAESKKAVIIKGLPLSANDKGIETKVALKNKFDKVLNVMGIRKDVKIDSIFRFRAKDENGAGFQRSVKVLPIRVAFCSNWDKDLFMANIKKLNDGEFKKLSIGLDVPKILLKCFRTLDQEGYQFRKDNEGASYYITFKKRGLILLGKLKTENRYKILKDMSC